jgi:cell division protein FtsB
MALVPTRKTRGSDFWTKALFGLLGLAFTFIAFFFMQELSDARRDLASGKLRQGGLEKRRDLLRREKADKEAYLVRIQNDVEFFRLEARQRLALARPGEIIFRVEQARP